MKQNFTSNNVLNYNILSIPDLNKINLLLMKKEKTIRTVPGILVGVFMIFIIIWGILGDKRCKNLMLRDECIQQVVICKYSKETSRGSGVEVSTGFVNPDDTLQYFTTKAFIKPLPVGLPIKVRYSLESKTCYKFLWDSTVVFNDFRVRFFHVKNQGMDYEIIKLREH
jgi:hypothetical protein